jgi:dihydropyrimidine dehydrogenase (NAD+) subunit PreT
MEAVFEELIPPLTEEQALVEADRCLECGGPYAEAPCVVGCAAYVDVPAFVAAIARGE